MPSSATKLVEQLRLKDISQLLPTLSTSEARKKFPPPHPLNNDIESLFKQPVENNK